MKKLRLNIDGKEVLAVSGQTILEVAGENGIFIPTLCHEERTKTYGACGICVCEVEGNPKLVKACATEVSDGMVIRTNTERVKESRKTNLELLLSNHRGDCRPPCLLACPAHTDCQGYVGLIANGEYDKAVELVRDTNPLPASIGRVCPHPCEEACRRGLVDEPISIMNLKRFIADRSMYESEHPFAPEIEEESGKSVGIIGGGPLGLSAAYFLRRQGHSVTIYEAMPKCGGMLRYGIPEYRLPKAVLDDEISVIENMGVEIKNNVRIGKDISFDSVKAKHDAVIVGIGAWVYTGVGCPGEDADGVIGGIDFLRRVARKEDLKLGNNVAIVGGGNTAMDACRTAVRMGAKKVYNIYRRTVEEMPADAVEIEEAMEEGVIFLNLRNPLEIKKDKNGHIKEAVLQVMELGEPDASGRRAPVAVKGKTETIKLDNLILAIGQAVDAEGFDMEKTRKGGIKYNPSNFMTSIPGVFAGGDCGNDKISIAVEAVGQGKKISEIVNGYLFGEELVYEDPFCVTRDDLTSESFEDRERSFRVAAEQLSAKERKDNFTEVVFGYTEEEALQEANRCLECGCHDYFECKLIDFAREYNVKPDRFEGEKNLVEFEDDHPFIVRDPNKCILCGKCVRVCEEVVGVGALGLVNRGFDTVVKPALENPLCESGCISCGQCVSVCPTGALQERQTVAKEVPVETDKTVTTCAFCSMGCSLELESCGEMLIKANPADGPVNHRMACGKGKWGFDTALVDGKLFTPLIKDGRAFRDADCYEAMMLALKKIEGIQARYGKDSVAVAVSDRYTTEEAYAMKKLADLLGARVMSFSNRQCGLESVLGVSSSPNTIDELLSTDVILVCGCNLPDSGIISYKLRLAKENGAKIILINPSQYAQNLKFADKCIYVKNDLSALRAFAKALINEGKTSNAEGFDEFAKALSRIKPGEEIAEAAAIYANAKKAMIVFQQNFASTEAAELIADIALLSGHIGSPRDGILMLKAKNNSEGLNQLGIKAGAESLEGVKAMIIFGEDPKMDLPKLDFLMVSDTHMTKTAKKADVIMPGTGFASSEGTFINTERRMQQVCAAIQEIDVEHLNWQIPAEMAELMEVDFGWEDTCCISEEMSDTLSWYRNSEIGEVLGGVLSPVDPRFEDASGVFADPLPVSDAHWDNIVERLPKAAK